MKAGDEVDVLLVSMPFCPLHQPSMGLELIKGTLEGEQARILYFALPYAHYVGPSLYDEVQSWLRDLNYVGDWIFSAALNGGDPRRDDGYFDEVLREGGSPVPAAKLEEILRLRQGVEDFLGECQRRIEAHQPRIVGFTSTFQQHVASLALAKRLKARSPELFVVFGGVNCEGAMGLETARQYPFVDAVVSGEGEVVFPALVERVLADLPVDDLQGLYTRANAGGLDSRRPPNAARVRDPDTLPRPDFGDFFAAWQESGPEIGKVPRLLFESSRGCWWGARSHCSFCGLNGASMAFRSKSAARVLDELSELAARYPGRRILLVDNILDMRYFRTLLPALAEADLGVELVCEVKANLRKDQVQLLYDAGVREMIPGVESFSDAVLRLMGKGVRALQSVQMLKWCAEIGIRPTYGLIWGFPGEPPREYRRIARRIPLLSHLQPPELATRIQLHRFSPNFERADEIGFTDVEPFPGFRHAYRLPPEALANLAYHFRYGYRDGRDVAAYTREMVQRIGEWRQAFASSELVYASQGEKLCLWDLRPIAARPLTYLSGLAKSCFLACDEAHSISWLARHAGNGAAVSENEVEEVIGPLIEEGLMLRDGDRVLSLAVGRPQSLRSADRPG